MDALELSMLTEINDNLRYLVDREKNRERIENVEREARFFAAGIAPLRIQLQPIGPEDENN